MEIKQFIEMLGEKGIELSSKQIDQFEKYYHTLVEWNNKMNLTAIVDKPEVYLKHFYDSISAAFYYDFSKDITICDVGAGAGFPSIPIKICFPHIKISIVDSLQKRITFLNHLANVLEIDHFHFHHDRAETFGQNKNARESYDLVIARAVARMSVLSELCLPLCKVGGTFIAMKGTNREDELLQGEKAIKLLGGKLETTHQFLLPFEESERNIIIVSKKKQTSKKYPRKPGIPNKSPLS